jgi:antitoxin Phd
MGVFMKTWQLQKAKAHLSDVVRQCNFEPQIISLRGVNTAVMINYEEYKKLSGPKKNIVSFLRSSPLCGLDIEFERDKSPIRDIEL